MTKTEVTACDFQASIVRSDTASVWPSWMLALGTSRTKEIKSPLLYQATKFWGDLVLQQEITDPPGTTNAWGDRSFSK